MTDRLITPTIEPHRGSLLVATPQLEDPNFRRSVVLVLEHGSEGSLGVILNRPSSAVLDGALPDWAVDIDCSTQVFSGGPVQPDAVLALAPVSEPWAGSTAVTEGIAILDLEADLDSDQLDASTVRYYIGYSGWSPGQLRLEIEEGAWWTFDAANNDLSLEPSNCWSQVLSRQRSAARLLAMHPDHSFLN